MDLGHKSRNLIIIMFFLINKKRKKFIKLCGSIDLGPNVLAGPGPLLGQPIRSFYALN